MGVAVAGRKGVTATRGAVGARRYHHTPSPPEGRESHRVACSLAGGGRGTGLRGEVSSCAEGGTARVIVVRARRCRRKIRSLDPHRAPLAEFPPLHAID
jgi:hypothetical protein